MKEFSKEKMFSKEKKFLSLSLVSGKCLIQRHPHQVSNLADKSGTAATTTEQTKPESKKKDIFVSYCWTNSFKSKENNEIPKLVGNEWNDPRKIKSLLAKKYNGMY
jgi:hypothetical protein